MFEFLFNDLRWWTVRMSDKKTKFFDSAFNFTIYFPINLTTTFDLIFISIKHNFPNWINFSSPSIKNTIFALVWNCSVLKLFKIISTTLLITALLSVVIITIDSSFLWALAWYAHVVEQRDTSTACYFSESILRIEAVWTCDMRSHIITILT